MPIVQISRIQHRRGKATDLPQLAAGEIGWSIDDQRLYIGNGTVADGAPAVGNTEIVTAGSSAFTTALTYVYKGYLDTATPILTGATGDVSRTLQATLDDYVSVKAFGAVGDGSTADAAAIQRAIEELYTDTDKADVRAHRILFFPAGQYNINTSIKIPPYAHLRGEGAGKTVFYQSGGNGPVAQTEDNTRANTTHGNLFGSITTTTPTQIQIEGICFRNGEAYAGLSIDCATHVYLKDCKFVGTYTQGGVDAANSKGVTVRSTTALPCSNIVFDQCQFTKFARLIDMSYNVTSVRFINCDFTTAYYGALLGGSLDGSSNGLTVGPRNIQFNSSSWSTISQQAIWSKNSSGSVYPRNVISQGNWFGVDIGNNFEGDHSIRSVPIIQFDNDECSSMLDFFERTDMRADGSSIQPTAELQGIGITTKAIKQATLTNNQSSATTIQEYQALAGKGLSIKYKIVRGTTDRTGELIVSASTNGVSYDDTYTESGADVGVTLSAVMENKDSTAGNETVALQYTTTNTGTAATLEYQTTILV